MEATTRVGGTDNKAFNTINSIVSPILTSVETTNESVNGDIQLGFTLGEDIIYNLERSTSGTENFEFSKKNNWLNKM